MRTILYICTTKDFRMKQRITLSLSESSINFAKKYAKKSNTSVSEMFDNYFGTLKKIEETNKSKKLAIDIDFQKEEDVTKIIERTGTKMEVSMLHLILKLQVMS